MCFRIVRMTHCLKLTRCLTELKLVLKRSDRMTLLWFWLSRSNFWMPFRLLWMVRLLRLLPTLRIRFGSVRCKGFLLACFLPRSVQSLLMQKFWNVLLQFGVDAGWSTLMFCRANGIRSVASLRGRPSQFSGRVHLGQLPAFSRPWSIRRRKRLKAQMEFLKVIWPPFPCLPAKRLRTCLRLLNTVRGGQSNLPVALSLALLRLLRLNMWMSSDRWLFTAFHTGFGLQNAPVRPYKLWLLCCPTVSKGVSPCGRPSRSGMSWLLPWNWPSSTKRECMDFWWISKNVSTTYPVSLFGVCWTCWAFQSVLSVLGCPLSRVRPVDSVWGVLLELP